MYIILEQSACKCTKRQWKCNANDSNCLQAGQVVLFFHQIPGKEVAKLIIGCRQTRFKGVYDAWGRRVISYPSARLSWASLLAIFSRLSLSTTTTTATQAVHECFFKWKTKKQRNSLFYRNNTSGGGHYHRADISEISLGSFFSVVSSTYTLVGEKTTIKADISFRCLFRTKEPRRFLLAQPGVQEPEYTASGGGRSSRSIPMLHWLVAVQLWLSD